MTKFSRIKLGFIFCLLLGNSCRRPISETPIGFNLANPTALATDENGDYFYVLNADSEHKYQNGSILILDSNANKVAHVSSPRLGRVIAPPTNKRMLIAFDRESEEENARLRLYSTATPANPSLIKEWKLESDCTPANVVSRKDYDYFALSCQEGQLYMGNFTSDLSQSTLAKVRNYPQIRKGARRAMYLDSKRELLFLFMTDIGNGSLTDLALRDAQTWSNGSISSDSTPDEIPDDYQGNSARARELLNNTTRFQFMVYDIAAHKDNFSFDEFKNVRSTEPRWLYFNLDNFGYPDDPIVAGDPNMKYYRSNFWEAQPDPDDQDVFYLSHPGLGKVGHSEHANDIVKVTFVGNPRVVNDSVPQLPSYMKFERAFGFKGDSTGPDKYYNSFLITKLSGSTVTESGSKIVIVNSFRDLSNFSNSRYILMAGDLPENKEPGIWLASASKTEINESLYSLALSKNGNLLSIAFFDASLRLYKVEFGKNLSLVKSVH